MRRSIADYSKAIELDASRLDAYQGRAWAYLKTGKAAEGLADAERSLQIKPDSPPASTPAGTSTRRWAVAMTPSPTSVARSHIEPRMQGSREGLQRLGANPDASD